MVDMYFANAAAMVTNHRAILSGIGLNPFLIGPIIIGFALIIRWARLRDRAGFVFFGVLISELVYASILLGWSEVILAFDIEPSPLLGSILLLAYALISAVAAGATSWHFRVKATEEVNL